MSTYSCRYCNKREERNGKISSGLNWSDSFDFISTSLDVLCGLLKAESDPSGI